MRTQGGGRDVQSDVDRVVCSMIACARKTNDRDRFLTTEPRNI